MSGKPEYKLGEILRDKKATIAVAESCSGGLISHKVTNVPGSSEYFERGVVTYSNRAKIDLLGVPEEIVARHGAVSKETALAMAVGIRRSADSTFGLAVTGIAGPGGGTPDKPVGLVYIAVSGPEGAKVSAYKFEGDRAAIKEKTAETALEWLLAEAGKL